MAIENSSDPAAFAAFEHQGWESVSSGYELRFSDLTSQSVPALLDGVNIKPEMSLLDVCTGPGIVAASAVERGAQVTGIDFSAEAVKIARRNVPGAVFEEGDAQSLPFSDNSFDTVVCGFGLMHLPDPQKALAEMHRVLKPGGRVAVSVWDVPVDDSGFGLLYAAIKAHADKSVSLPHGPDFFQFSGENKLADALQYVGFSGAAQQSVNQFWVMSDPLGIVQGILEGAVRARGLLLAQSEAVQQAIFDEVVIRMKPFIGKDSLYHVPTPALIGSGRVAKI